MEELVQEYPKMLYLHPVDKTQEHKTFIVNSSDEETDAKSIGWKLNPHVPVAPADDRFETQYVTDATPASSYNEHWDTGFAQPGDPYGIQSEYLLQSANPDAAV